MIELLRALRKKVVIGFVGGSDLIKITEQLQTGQMNSVSPIFTSSAI
jgi:phosphomannomutase